jgi:hypothetical protein
VGRHKVGRGQGLGVEHGGDAVHGQGQVPELPGEVVGQVGCLADVRYVVEPGQVAGQQGLVARNDLG